MQTELQPARTGKVASGPSVSETVLSPSQADSDSPATSASSASSSTSSTARSDPKYREMKMKYLRALNVTTLAPGFRPRSAHTRSTPIPLPDTVSGVAHSPAAIATPESTHPVLQRTTVRDAESNEISSAASPDLPPLAGSNTGTSSAGAAAPGSRDSTPSPLPTSPRTPSLLSQQLKALRGTSPVQSDTSDSEAESSSPVSGGSRRLGYQSESEVRSSPIPIPRASRPRAITRPAGPLGDRRRRNGRVALDSVTDAPLPVAFTLSSSVAAQPFTASGAGSVAFSFSEVFASRSSHSMAPQSFALAGLALPAPVYESDDASETTGVSFSVEL